MNGMKEANRTYRSRQTCKDWRITHPDVTLMAAGDLDAMSKKKDAQKTSVAAIPTYV